MSGVFLEQMLGISYIDPVNNKIIGDRVSFVIVIDEVDKPIPLSSVLAKLKRRLRWINCVLIASRYTDATKAGNIGEIIGRVNQVVEKYDNITIVLQTLGIEYEVLATIYALNMIDGIILSSAPENMQLTDEDRQSIEQSKSLVDQIKEQ